jgi:hypothetical protein
MSAKPRFRLFSAPENLTGDLAKAEARRETAEQRLAELQQQLDEATEALVAGDPAANARIEDLDRKISVLARERDSVRMLIDRINGQIAAKNSREAQARAAAEAAAQRQKLEHMAEEHRRSGEDLDQALDMVAAALARSNALAADLACEIGRPLAETLFAPGRVQNLIKVRLMAMGVLLDARMDRSAPLPSLAKAAAEAHAYHLNPPQAA